MRQLMYSKAVKSLCYTLVVALLSTIAPPLIQPASAQLLPQYAVGVVDFTNETGVQGELLSRLATDAVVVELSKTSRYDVSGITRTMVQKGLETLDLHTPLNKQGLVRLGEELQADSMLEGAIKSVQLSGSGATRRASVTLACQMIDQTSGEVLNGAIQTGHSSARVGYTPDDDALIVEAINDASFMLVKTMVDYIIPEATVMINIGSDQVMVNKGSREGLKPGMRMIVLRQKEIIGYIELRTVSPLDSIAKVVKTMRGIQPEDKVRAIFDMPAVNSSMRSEAMPSSAPSSAGGGKDTLSKIGKFILGAGIVFGLVSLFKGGRGTEDAPGIGTGKNPTTLTWNTNKYANGQAVVEYQILRDEFANGASPFAVIPNNAVDAGKFDVYSLYNTGLTRTVLYYNMDTNPTLTKPTQASWTVPDETYGVTHNYQVQVIYSITTGSTTGTDSTATPTIKYFCTPASNIVTATAIEPVLNSDVVEPAYDPDAAAPELSISDIQQHKVNFMWNRKAGADVYYMKVEPVIAGKAPSWTSNPMVEVGPVVTLPANEKIELASMLAPAGDPNRYEGVVMKWRVYCQHQADTSSAWVEGAESRFTIGAMPPDGPGDSGGSGDSGGDGTDGPPSPP